MRTFRIVRLKNISHSNVLKNIFLFISLTKVFFGFHTFGFIIPESERPEQFFPQLHEALLGLEENSPILLSYEFDIEEASANHTVSLAEKGVRVGISLYGNSIHEDRPGENFYHRYRTFNQIYFRKPLYHWGAIHAQSEIANLNKQKVKKDFIYRKRNLEGDTRASFLKLVTLNYRIELVRKQLKIAKENLSNIEQRASLGLSTNLSLEEARIEPLRIEIHLSELSTEKKKQENQFVRLTGYEEKLSFLSMSDFWMFCLNHNFQKEYPTLIGGLSSTELNSLRTLLEIEENRLKITDAELKPKLNLMGSFFQDQVDVAASEGAIDRNNFVVGVEANWLLWDSHKSSAQKKAVLARKRKIEQSIEQKNREIREFIDGLVQELRALEERIYLGRDLITLAEGRMDKSKLEFEMDRISSQDYLSAQMSLDQAKLANLESICRYLSLLDHYEKAVGSPELGEL